MKKQPSILLFKRFSSVVKSLIFTVILVCAGLMASLGAVITSFAPAKGPVGTLITVKGTSLQGATIVNIGGVPAIIISKESAMLVAMVMPGAATGAVSVTFTTTTLTALANFMVTDTPYPIAQQGRKLVDGAAQYSLFGSINSDYYQTEQGSSVAISADGNTAIVGNGAGMAVGSGVIFYIRDNKGRWRADSKVIAPEFASGSSVALSADGNTAIVGARLVGGLQAAILTKTNGSWSNPTIQLLGKAKRVSITADGSTVILSGSFILKPDETYEGVSLYTRDVSGWKKVPTPSTSNYKFFGVKYSFAVSPVGLDAAISGDGKTVAMIAESNGLGGYTVVYTRPTRTSNKWAPQKLLPEFGKVYLSADGNTLIGSFTFLDAMTIYKRNGNEWVFKQQLNEHGEVAMTADASTLMLPKGAAVYTLVNGMYIKKGELKPGGNAVSIALSADGTTALMGDPTDETTPKKIVLEEWNGDYADRQPQPLGGAYVFSSNQPEVAASAITFANNTGTTTSVSWTIGSGTGRAVFIKDTAAGEPSPEDIYYSSNVRYHSGYPIGKTGWYCIYNGIGSTVNVVGLVTNKTYRVAVMEYKGTIDKPQFLQAEITPANVATPLTAPSGYATGLAFSNTAATSTTLSWLSGNGSARAVFLKAGTSGALNLVQAQTYIGDGTFTAGSPVGSNGWYCVYNGTGNAVNLLGLTASTTYRAIVIEYNGAPGMEAYNLTRYNAANVTTTANANLLAASINNIGIAPNNIGGPVVANNILSPNGDGKNDIWIVNNLEFHPNNTVSVVDAGGNVVFNKKGYANDWAGTYHGDVLKEGTYYYTIDLDNSSLLKGFFTVVRDK